MRLLLLLLFCFCISSVANGDEANITAASLIQKAANGKLPAELKREILARKNPQLDELFAALGQTQDAAQTVLLDTLGQLVLIEDYRIAGKARDKLLELALGKGPTARNAAAAPFISPRSNRAAPRLSW